MENMMLETQISVFLTQCIHQLNCELGHQLQGSVFRHFGQRRRHEMAKGVKFVRASLEILSSQQLILQIELIMMMARYFAMFAFHSIHMADIYVGCRLTGAVTQNKKLLVEYYTVAMHTEMWFSIISIMRKWCVVLAKILLFFAIRKLHKIEKNAIHFLNVKMVHNLLIFSSRLIIYKSFHKLIIFF